MIVRVLKLNNIRSYQEASIEFPKGSFLLSGDIGSGKTTILIAIEFALFGLLRGSINGSDILRHGTNEGSVLLTFELKNKNYSIFRRIKRTSTGISQDSGYLEVDGVKESLVHTELKSRVLEILGYPKNLISKSKGLIFRYTTYTPQEEVKKIMYETAEVRLDTLRKVFGLDKYKIAKENTQLLIKEIKQKEAIISLKLEEETIIEEERNRLIKQIEITNKELILVSEEETKKKQALETIKNQVEKIIKEKEIVEETKQKKSLINARIEEQKERIKLLNNKIQNTIIGEKPRIIPIDEINNKLTLIKEKKISVEKKIVDAREKIISIETKKSILEENYKIQSITTCPTCKQEVTPEHKEEIKQKTIEEIGLLNKNRGIISEYLLKAQTNKELIEKKLEETLLEQKNALINEQEIKAYNQRVIWKNELEQDLQEAKNHLINYEEQEKKIIIPEFNQKNYDMAKEIMEERKEELNKLLIKKATLENDKNHDNKKLEEIIERLNKVRKNKKTLEEWRKKRIWLSEYFINSLSSIEKNLLLRIHYEFNSSFQDWFETLISDETITARLDETFTPYIIQNGQTTTFENLSGGEKTSLSLAYRLSLNKVIIDFVNNINTKDLIILDEPTDGFSSTQLDKIRDVLEKIPAQQVIIVSHEPKLESFVEEIIRVHKSGHISHAS